MHDAAYMVAGGSSDSLIASELGIRESTVARWRGRADFLRIVEKYRREKDFDALNAMQHLLDRAIYRIHREMDSNHPDARMVQAALAVLKLYGVEENCLSNRLQFPNIADEWPQAALLRPALPEKGGDVPQAEA